MDEQTETVCTSLVGKLPISVDGYRRVNTDPKSTTTAAWGPPFITLRCGVPTPAALGPASSLVTVNGVDWFAEELTNGTVFTTVGREANVEITVPADVEPAVNVVTDVCETVSENDPVLPN